MQDKIYKQQISGFLLVAKVVVQLTYKIRIWLAQKGCLDVGNQAVKEVPKI